MKSTERMRAKRATDPEYLAKERIANRERMRAKRATDPEYREKERITKRDRDREYNRANRIAGANNAKHQLRRNVRRITNNLIRAGLLEQPAECETCKAPGKPQAHHLHYDQRDSPLAIQWLCRDCHAKTHRKYDALTITEE